MTTNKYFSNFTYGREQDTQDDLIVESIKIYGQDVKYMPRTLVKEDDLFGEDILSKFETAVDLEMYIKNTTGFEGEGDFLSKFGLEIRDQVTFTMARKRWDQITTEKIIDEVGFNYQIETANTGAYSNSHSLMLETGSANGYSISSSRPNEGDLIFFPLNEKLYEIKFVEHEEIFYPHGKLYTYDLTCELFQYSSQQLDTGNTAIDSLELSYSADQLFYQFTLENGDTLTGEDGDYIVQEYRLETTDNAANNEFFTQQSLDFIDFSETNPFSEVDRY
jgi:hypothetical protein|tara:strand:- start:87 stop:917 length:831 start_codon:yes stop_codon:yes gene_type:complete